MHDLIVAPALGTFVVVRPGHNQAVKLSGARYAELASIGNGLVPSWLVDVARQSWALDLRGPVAGRLLVRHQFPARAAKASWEIDLTCNWACPHCYLGTRPRGGLDHVGQVRLMRLLADAGVLWLQITGGEPTLAAGFPAAYAAAWDLGMLVTVSTNGSRLDQPGILDLFSNRRPHRLRVSLYGVDESTYQAVTGGRGSWAALCRGLQAARGAGLPVELRAVVTADNVGQVPRMRQLAREWGLPLRVYSDLSPTIDGGSAPLLLRTEGAPEPQKPFTTCTGGRTSFHVDPHGQAMVCKIARDLRVDLIGDGLAALDHLVAGADALLTRTGICAGCAVVNRCPTCPPLAHRFHMAGASPKFFCPLRAET
jgi:sulfatase maturation enzyme AslB (radical SAM superfamily)